MSKNEICNKVTLTIINQRGLHARASAKFVKCAEEFSNTIIFVEKDDISVLATSIMGLMMLAASKDTTIQVSATGDMADEAIQALTDLVENKFNEEI